MLCDTESDESDGCSRYADLCRENDRLLRANNELSCELDSMQIRMRQIAADDAAAALTKITIANNEICRLKKENEDLTQRLRIAQNRSDDVYEPIQTPELVHRPSNARVVMRQRKEKWEESVRSLESRVEKEKSDRKQLESEATSFRVRVDALLELAGGYFGCLVDTPEMLIDCFRTKRPVQDKSDIRKLRDRVILLKKEVKQRDHNIVTGREAATADAIVRESLKKEIAELQTQTGALMDRLQIAEREREQLIRENTERVAQAEAYTLEIDGVWDSRCHKLATNLAKASEEICSISADNEQLKNREYRTLLKMKTLQSKCQELESYVRGLGLKRSHLEADNKHIVGQMAQKDVQAKDLECCLKRAKDAMATKQMEIEHMKEQCDAVENRMKQSLREAADLRRERDELVERDREASLTKVKMENALERMRVISLATKSREPEEVHSQIPQLIEESRIPISVWTCAEFPKSLQSLVVSTARSCVGNVTVVVERCLRVISQWLSEQLESFGRVRKAHAELRGQAKALANCVKKMMPNLRVNFDLLLSDDMMRELVVNEVDRMRSDLNNARHEVDVLAKKAGNACSILCVNDLDDAMEVAKTIARLAKRAKTEKGKRLKLESKLNGDRCCYCRRSMTDENV